MICNSCGELANITVSSANFKTNKFSPFYSRDGQFSVIKWLAKSFKYILKCTGDRSFPCSKPVLREILQKFAFFLFNFWKITVGMAILVELLIFVD